jgi:protein phosphatase
MHTAANFAHAVMVSSRCVSLGSRIESAAVQPAKAFRGVSVAPVTNWAPIGRGMGTTLTAARTMGRHLQIVHVGDSRAYLLRDARLLRLTRDHTYVQWLVDNGRLSEQEAATFGARHLLVKCAWRRQR